VLVATGTMPRRPLAVAKGSAGEAGDLSRDVYLFEDLNGEQRQRMLRSMRPVELRSGEWLFAQGDAAERFYVVSSGRIVLFRESRAGEEKIIAVIEPGETFGEGPVFIPDGRYALNARAVADCSLMAFDNQQLRLLMNDSVELCFKLMATLRRRESFLLDEIEQITLQTATQRVLTYLLQQAESAEAGDRITLGVPKHILASRLTIKPETLSRVLARLRAKSVIRFDGEAIVIVDRKNLEVEKHCNLCGGRSWGCPGPQQSGK